ncbi:MAG: hypothetical protein MRY83_10310, partial [Flavobacteriales bacterium]|nr:hypothetical protein [Flavobacteriales bacterium]
SYAYYQGTANQTVRSAQYGQLRFYYNNDKTLDGPVDALNHIYIFDDADLHSNNFDIECGGHWYNHYTGEFYAGTGKVTMDGTNFNQALQIADNGLNKAFYDLEINCDNAYYSYPGVDKLTVLNDLTVIQGRFYPAGRDIEVGNNMLASGTGYWWNTNGDYILNKASGSANISFNGGTVGALTLGTGATTAEYTLQDNAIIYNAFQIRSGTTFDGNGQEVEFRGNGDAITVDGIYKMGPAGDLQMENNSTLAVNAGAEFEAVGTTSDPVTITNNTGRYNFNVDGKISAKYALFEFMENGGVVVGSTGWVDSTDNFSFCTFNNCDWGGACLTIENNQQFTDSATVPGNQDPWIEDASFPTNPFGGASNVKKVVSTMGTIEFFNSTGTFEGEDYDNDPSDIIDWIEPQEMYWTGNIDDDWYNVGNWAANFGSASVPDRDLDAIIPAGRPRYPNLTVGAAEVKNLNIELGGIVTMNTPADSDSDLVVFSELANDGVLFMNSVNDTLYLSGNFSQSATGVFTANAGRVIMVPTSGVASISNLYPFNHLESSATSSVSLSSNVQTNGEFKINSGSFDINNRTLTLKDDFLNSGTMDGGTGTVYLDGAGSHTFKPGNGSFYNLEASGSGTYTMSTDNLQVDRHYQQTNGTMNVGALTFNLGDNSGTDNLDINGGTLIIGDNGTIAIGSNSAISVNGGTFVVAGSSGNLATVTRQAGNTGNYGFTVNSGATFKANYATFEYMNSSGITVASGATVDLDSNFSYCTFQNCHASGACLTYNGSQVLTGTERVLQATFADAVAAGKSNVRRTNSGAGEIEFLFADGPMSGEDYDNDAHDKIHWSAEVVWTGGALNQDWDDPANWNDGIGGGFVPTALIDAVVPDVSGTTNSFPLIDAATITGNTGYANKLTIDANATVDLAANTHMWLNDSLNNSGTLTVGAGSSVVSTRSSLMNNGILNFNADSLNIEDNFTNSSTLNLGANTLMRIGGDFTNSSTFTMAAGSKLEFYKATGTVVFNSGGATLEDMSFKSETPSTAVFQTGSALNIDGDVTIEGGEFEVANPAHTVSVGGNWTNSVGATGFDGGTGTVVMDGGASQLIDNSTASFYNLQISNTAADVQPSADLNVSNNFTIDANADFRVNGRDLYIGGDFTNNEGATGFDPGTRAVVLNGSGAQVISSVTSPINFYELQLNKSAGTVTIGGGADLDIAGRMFINDDNGGGTFSPGSATITVEGNWRNEEGATGFTEGTSTVVFDGAGNSEIISTAAAQNFYNMTVNKGNATARVRTQPGTDLDINNDLVITQGILSVTDFATESTINIAGDWTNNRGTAGFEEGNVTATVIFDGTAANQTISSVDATETFFNVTIANANPHEVRSDAGTLLDIDGSLTIDANGTLNPQNKNITIAGNWTNNSSSSGYEQGTETVTFDGSSNQTITNNAFVETFDEVVIATTSGADVRTSGLNMTLDIDGDLTINNNSILNMDAGDGNIVLAGQWDNNNGAAGFVQGSTTERVTFNGVNQEINSTAATETFNNITVSSTGSLTLDAATDLDVDGDLNISAGGVLDVNTNNNDVTIAGNWDNQNGAAGFDQGTETVTFDGSGAQQISSVATETFHDLTLANGGNTITMNVDVQVDDVLDLSTSGYIDANGNTFTLDNWRDGTSIANLGANVDRFIIINNGTENFVINGVDVGETAIFPIGISAATTGFGRVDFNNTGAGSEDVAVEIWNHINEEGTGSGGTVVPDDVLAYTWDITPVSNDGDEAANLTIYWDVVAEKTTFDNTQVRMSHHNGTNWEYITLEGAAINVVGTTWNFSGSASAFSPFTVDAKPSSPLPVELTDFVAYLEEGIVKLEWETATEINNDYFVVERSKDGDAFEVIANVDGAGNSNTVRNYEAEDADPYIGLSYYRLKQVDFNGKTTYTKLVPVNNDPFVGNTNPDKSFSIFPNPSDGEFINISSNRKYLPHDEVFVVVTDANGKEMYSKVVITNDQGEFATAIDPYDRIPAGIYVVIGSSSDDIYSDILVIE